MTDAELQQLPTWSRSTTTAFGLVRRANVILGINQRHSVKEAARNAGLSETHARKVIKVGYVPIATRQEMKQR